MADSNVMETITWTTGAGHQVEVTVSAQYGLTNAGVRKTGGEKRVEVTATLNGADHFAPMGYQILKTPQGPAVAKIGQIGIVADNANKIEAAIASVNAEIAAHNAALQAHAAELDKAGNGDINQWEKA